MNHVPNEFKLEVPCYDDQQVNIGTVQKGSSAPVDTAYRGSSVLAFAAGQDNSITFDLQYTHGVKTGSSAEFHIHATPADDNGGDIKLQLTVSYASIGNDFPAETTITETKTIEAGSQHKHLVIDFETVFASDLDISGIALCSLTRLGTDEDDTYAESIYLLSLDSHCEINTLGSRWENAK